MSKLLVRTLGAFQLLLEDTGELVRHEGISVVKAGSYFLQERVGKGQVEVVDKVSEIATQADWDDTLSQSDGDEELALASFVKEFPPSKKHKHADDRDPDPLPSTKIFGGANASGQTGGLAPDVKPAAPGQTEGPGGPKDTNQPKAAQQQHAKK